MPSIFNKKIASHTTRKWFIVLAASLILMIGFEVSSYLIGINQVQPFLKIALLFYLFLLFNTSYIFDLKLKYPRSWQRSKYYYFHNKERFLKWFRIVARALALRFRYAVTWEHWMNFQNYIILPAVMYWAIIVHIFLNPFNIFTKQVIVLAGSLVLSALVWHLKIIFVHYKILLTGAKNILFGASILAAFLMFSGMLGFHWYIGFPTYYFIVGVSTVSFLLFYQLLFHRVLVSLSRIGLNLLFAAVMGFVAYIIHHYWTVNYYSAGLLLAACCYLFWGLSLDYFENKRTPGSTRGYVLTFLMVVFYVLATTNFQARIG